MPAPSPLMALNATIPSGQSLSNGVDLSAGRVVALRMPDGWTSAPITFQGSPDGVTYADMFRVQDAVSALVPQEVVFSPTVVPRAIVLINVESLRGIYFMKIRSGTRSQPVLQEAERTFVFTIET